MKNNSKKIVAIITARGGSKGLIKKNLRKINRKPLVYYSIKAASKSKIIDKVIVSTDSHEIARISKKYGAEVPFIRPAYLSRDNTSSYMVLKHALNYLKKNNEYFDYFVLLEPTSPLTTSIDVDKAIIKLTKNKKADSIVGVSKIENSHPVFSLKINKKGFTRPYILKEFESFRRQKISDLFFFDGSLYISKTDTYFKKKTFYHDKTLPYFFPKWKSFEIDDMIDLICVRSIYDKKNILKKN